MNLENGLKYLFDAQDKVRTPTGISDPLLLSTQMMRMSQFIGVIEQKLAEIEEAYEIEFARKHLIYMSDYDLKSSPAETSAKRDLAKEKGQILYLSRIVRSAWSQVGIIQSRINHLTKESGLGKYQT